MFKIFCLLFLYIFLKIPTQSASLRDIFFSLISKVKEKEKYKKRRKILPKHQNKLKQ